MLIILLINEYEPRFLITPKKYQNNFTYYIDLDNNLYEITVENHEPIIHNKITNYESILDALEIKFHKGGPK